MNIPVGKTGIIRSGDEAGKRVRIQDDRQNTGGFFILTWNVDGDGRTINGADAWVESQTQLEGYIKESCWNVEWNEENEK